MNCEKVRIRIDDYLDGELSKNDAMNIQKHLETCKDCEAEIKSMDKSVQLMRTIFDDSDPPDTLRDKVFKKLDCC